MKLLEEFKQWVHDSNVDLYLLITGIVLASAALALYMILAGLGFLPRT